ncbi:hypothetical protein HY409_01115 [Candidatus Gottesmanbacteria bacterium]|nr:hypothetical protein [Candidatus Gottesmanbacteria bacterium]
MNKITSSLHVFVPLFAVTLICIEVIVANQLTTLQRYISGFESSIKFIKVENDLLSLEVASASALASIEKKAQLLDLRKSLASDFIHIGIESVALGISPRLEPALFAGNSGVSQ